MSRIRGVSETASQPMITVWCAKGQHNVQVASQVFADDTKRHGCSACRDKEFDQLKEPTFGAPILGPNGTGGKASIAVELPDGTVHDLEVDWKPGVDIKPGDILTLELEGIYAKKIDQSR